MPTLRIDNVPVSINYVHISIGGKDPEPPPIPENTYAYNCRDGQTISGILYEEYGYVNSALLNEVLNLNQGLSALPPLLRVGTRIYLPETETDKSVPTIPVLTLWD